MTEMTRSRDSIPPLQSVSKIFDRVVDHESGLYYYVAFLQFIYIIIFMYSNDEIGAAVNMHFD